MKKNMKLIGLSLLVSTLLLTSCNLFPNSFSPYEFSDQFVSQQYSNENVELVSQPSKHFFDVTRSNPNSGLRTLTLKSTGQQRLLVLPIHFSDYSLDKLDGNNGIDTHVRLQNAFFGQPEAVMWESVSSFYYRSSYGKLKLEGTVAPWFESQEYTIAKINSEISGVDKQTITGNLLREAVENFKASHSAEEVAFYDSDEDGYIDATYLVYAYPYSNSRDLDTKNIFWAFATYDEKSGHQGPGPFAHNYAWSSSFFMDAHQTLLDRRPDSHTFIHEVTHLFGIPDYYNVELDAPSNPVGGFDMMDYTVGDHTTLTKLLLEWANPLVLKQEGEVKLRPFAKTGDVLIIPSVWNGNFLDEFLALEYYTPTDLNQFDSRLNDQFKLPNRAGLKVYHIDARTVYEVRDQSLRTYVYSDEYQEDSAGLFEMLAHTNTTGGINRGKKPEFNLYSLLEKSGDNTFAQGGKASEQTLFYKGDSFGLETFSDFTFNRGMKIDYSFTIKNQNSDYITIEFSKKI